MKRILVPTDFSDHAGYAAEVAASIAKKSEGRIFLLHVIDIPSYVDTHGSTFENVPEGIAALKVTKKRFKELLSKPYFEGVNVGEVLQFENIYDQIVDFTDENDIDLIVMGSHGASGLKEFFIGSNTQKIVRTSDCPVLSVKNEISDFDPNSMVFASEFTDETPEAFRSIKKIADYFNTKVHLVKIVTKENFEPTSQSLEKMQKLVDEFNLENYSMDVYNASRIESGIDEFTALKKADMIAIATRGRSTFSQIFHESLAENLVNHSEFPVLSVRI